MTFLKGYSVFKLKSFFSETVELFETKYYENDFGSTEMKICKNGHDYEAPMPIYDNMRAMMALDRSPELILAMKVMPSVE